VDVECKRYTRVLTIAGSDSGGGAGVQADLKTFSALGCYGMSVVTALTAQNTKRVISISQIPDFFIREQLQAVFEDIGVDAVKIGMLHDAHVIHVVAQALQKYRVKKIILDPVMIATTGATLLQDEAVDVLKKALIPLVDVITPNLQEAAFLLDRPIARDVKEMERMAKMLCELGSRAALIKGGHSSDPYKSDDCFFMAESDKTVWFSDQRIKTKNIHGAGCTFSSAIAAFFAQGDNLIQAVENAKKYVGSAIRAGSHYQLGQGTGPVHHFWEKW